MNILILGSGCREHAIAWKLSQSKRAASIFIAPGNAGTGQLGTNLMIQPEDFSQVGKAVLDYSIGMLVVGPEAPLVSGIVDYFSRDARLKQVIVIGPGKAGAMLEGSKQYAKEFMKRHNIPTAAFGSFVPGDTGKAMRFMETMAPPYVLKADGLAGGKGVLILDSLEEAGRELNNMFAGKFGNAGKRVVIEEFLDGIELSVIIVTDGVHYKILPPAKDYKRAGEGGSGPNTGGMGAVSPVPFAGGDFVEKVENRIIRPVLKGLRSEGCLYRGFLYFGLMNVKGDPYVIEFNARLGDPEAEVILPRIESDFLDLLEGVAHGDLDSRELKIDPRVAVTVMLVSGGYPGDFERGKVVSGLSGTYESLIFHAGTTLEGQNVVSSGGRVLALTSMADNMEEALARSYRTASGISFEGARFRKDIGYDLKQNDA